MESLKAHLYRLLRSSERYTKTDMVYVGKSTFWLAVGQGAAMLVSLVLSVVFANHVSKQVFGIYKYVLSVAGSLSAFSLTGMNTVVTRAVSQGYDGTFKHSLLLQLRWNIPQCILALIVAGYYFMQGNHEYSIAFTIVAVFGPVSSVANTFNAFLHGKQDFATSTRYTSSSAVVYLAVMIATVWFLPNMIWLVAAYFVTISLCNVYLTYRTLKKYPTQNDTLRPDDISYAKRLSGMNLINSLAYQADSLIVYHLLGPTELAIYAFSILLPDRIRTVLNTLSSSVLPKIAAKSPHDGLRDSLTRKMVQLGVLSGLLVVTYAAGAPYVFDLLFPEYHASILYSQLYAITLLMIPSFVTVPALYARQREHALVVLNIAVPILKIAVSFAAVFLYGILGAILARIAYYLAHMAFAAYYVRTDASA